MLPAQRPRGFTLVELMITIAVIGLLASIAYPSYVGSIAKSKRRAAQTCLSDHATYMERFYTTNLRYDQDAAANAMNTAALQALNLACRSPEITGKDYTYSFATGFPTATAFTLQAVPTSIQATRDASCGTLTLTHTGTRGVSGSAGPAACW